MDEKQTRSSHSSDTDENRSETIATDDPFNASAASGLSDGGWTFVTQAHYDPEEPRDLTTVVVRAIAEAEGVSIDQVRDPPLYDVVDIAGIDAALFGRPDADRSGTGSSVEFRYDGYKVAIEADGWVTVLGRATNAADDGA